MATPVHQEQRGLRERLAEVGAKVHKDSPELAGTPAQVELPVLREQPEVVVVKVHKVFPV